MSSSLTPRKWVVFVLINVLVSAITALVLIRVLNSEPALSKASPQPQPQPPVAQPSAAAPVGDAPQATAATSGAQAPAPAPMDGAAATPNAVETSAAAPVPATKPAAAAAATPAATAPGVVSVRISGVQFPGQRTRESVAILNEGDQVDLSGWSIEAPGNKTYTFKSFVLFRDSFITLYTTNGSDSPTSLFWNQAEAVWKKGDTVTLKQGDKVVATYTVK